MIVFYRIILQMFGGLKIIIGQLVSDWSTVYSFLIGQFIYPSNLWLAYNKLQFQCLGKKFKVQKVAIQWSSQLFIDQSEMSIYKPRVINRLRGFPTWFSSNLTSDWIQMFFFLSLSLFFHNVIFFSKSDDIRMTKNQKWMGSQSKSNVTISKRETISRNEGTTRLDNLNYAKIWISMIFIQPLKFYFSQTVIYKYFLEN